MPLIQKSLLRGGDQGTNQPEAKATANPFPLLCLNESGFPFRLLMRQHNQILIYGSNTPGPRSVKAGEKGRFFSSLYIPRNLPSIPKAKAKLYGKSSGFTDPNQETVG